MRDRTKYLYVTVGIPLYSEELADLQGEATSYDVSLARMISMLLIDRYGARKGRGQGIWYPRDMQVVSSARPVHEEEQALPMTDTVKMRAVLAASEWDEE